MLLVVLTAVEATVVMFAGAAGLGFNVNHQLGTGVAAAGAAVVVLGLGALGLVVAIVIGSGVALVRLARSAERAVLPEALLGGAIAISPGLVLVTLSGAFFLPLLLVEGLLLAGWKWKPRLAWVGLTVVPALGLLAAVASGFVAGLEESSRQDTGALRRAIAAGDAAGVDRWAGATPAPVPEWVAMELEDSPGQLALWEHAMLSLKGELPECVQVVRQIAQGHPEAVDACVSCRDNCVGALTVQLALHQEAARAEKLGAHESLWSTFSVLQANDGMVQVERIARGAGMLDAQGAFLPRLHNPELLGLWRNDQPKNPQWWKGRVDLDLLLLASLGSDGNEEAALFDAGATARAKDPCGATAFTTLVVKGTVRKQTVELLLHHGAALNEPAPPPCGADEKLKGLTSTTPLWWVARKLTRVGSYGWLDYKMIPVLRALGAVAEGSEDGKTFEDTVRAVDPDDLVPEQE